MDNSIIFDFVDTFEYFFIISNLVIIKVLPGLLKKKIFLVLYNMF